MKKQKRLLIARNIFVFFLFVILGVIVVTEKSKGLLIPMVQNKMNDYFDKNFSEIKEEVTKEDTTYKTGIYSMKIISKENKHLYFYITGTTKKLKDTYQKDYVEGKPLFSYLTKKLEKTIKEKTNTSPSIEIISTLDKYTSTVKERILKEENLEQLKFYILKKELLIDDWTPKSISNDISNMITKYEENNITPKYYQLTITNKKDITESIEIRNIPSSFRENTSKEQIINDIIEDNNSKLLKENKIKYKYLNEEE